MEINKTSSISPLLRISQVAEALGISRSFAYNLINKGEIPHVKIGSAIRVKRDDLLSYIDKKTSPSTNSF
ncbi:helix-turn-helix domain-containing protein [bacterium]|nr:helix-turn-helix domain-containing protein [bacterium]